VAGVAGETAPARGADRAGAVGGRALAQPVTQLLVPAGYLSLRIEAEDVLGHSFDPFDHSGLLPEELVDDRGPRVGDVYEARPDAWQSHGRVAPFAAGSARVSRSYPNEGEEP
jgi:hypothetical protein